MQTSMVSGRRTRRQGNVKEGINQGIVSIYVDNLQSTAGSPQQQTQKPCWVVNNEMQNGIILTEKLE